MRAVNRFGPSRASVATSKVCRTDVGREYTFGFSTITWVSEMWGSRTSPPPPPWAKKVKCHSGGSRPSDKGGGGGHPHPGIREGWSQKKLFSALRASVWSKSKRGTGPSRPLPWIRHYITLILVFRSKKNADFWVARWNHVLCKSFKVTAELVGLFLDIEFDVKAFLEERWLKIFVLLTAPDKYPDHFRGNSMGAGYLDILWTVSILSLRFKPLNPCCSNFLLRYWG